jgi:hypothetical protein
MQDSRYGSRFASLAERGHPPVVRAKLGARLRKVSASGMPLTVEAANAQAESVVAPPMLNDPGHWEREARRSPIAPPAALLDALKLPTSPNSDHAKGNAQDRRTLRIISLNGNAMVCLRHLMRRLRRMRGEKAYLRKTRRNTIYHSLSAPSWEMITPRVAAPVHEEKKSQGRGEFKSSGRLSSRGLPQKLPLGQDQASSAGS